MMGERVDRAITDDDVPHCAWLNDLFVAAEEGSTLRAIIARGFARPHAAFAGRPEARRPVGHPVDDRRRRPASRPRRAEPR
jgi:hypothetical protein